MPKLLFTTVCAQGGGDGPPFFEYFSRGVASSNCLGGGEISELPGGESAPSAHRGVREGGCAPLRSWKILDF